ncbi:MAG: hypothetical protein HQK51_14310 [Oligoflexia bacterium]|nr:hypothetical protein [Oligoflexia bacterium]
MMFLKLFFSIFMIIILINLGWTSDNNKNNSSDIITLKDGSHFSLSKSLKMEKTDSYIRITTPEQDVTIHFLELPYNNNSK